MESEDEPDDVEALIAEFSAADPTFPAALVAAEERLALGWGPRSPRWPGWRAEGWTPASPRLCGSPPRWARTSRSARPGPRPPVARAAAGEQVPPRPRSDLAGPLESHRSLARLVVCAPASSFVWSPFWARYSGSRRPRSIAPSPGRPARGSGGAASSGPGRRGPVPASPAEVWSVRHPRLRRVSRSLNHARRSVPVNPVPAGGGGRPGAGWPSTA